jgi:hypothetical protein
MITRELLQRLEDTIKKELSMSDKQFNKLFGKQFWQLRFEADLLSTRKNTMKILCSVKNKKLAKPA